MVYHPSWVPGFRSTWVAERGVQEEKGCSYKEPKLEPLRRASGHLPISLWGVFVILGGPPYPAFFFERPSPLQDFHNPTFASPKRFLGDVGRFQLSNNSKSLESIGGRFGIGAACMGELRSERKL